LARAEAAARVAGEEREPATPVDHRPELEWVAAWAMLQANLMGAPTMDWETLPIIRTVDQMPD